MLSMFDISPRQKLQMSTRKPMLVFKLSRGFQGVKEREREKKKVCSIFLI